MTTYREIQDRDVERAMETWGDREGMNDALNDLPANPRRHSTHPSFEDPYRIAYRETRAGMDELARIEAREAAHPARTARPSPDGTTSERIAFWWFIAGYGIGSLLTTIAALIAWGVA